MSYNDTVVHSKAEGAPIEQFKIMNFDLDNLSETKNLEKFFKTYVYSTNKWIGRGNRGQALGNGYEGFCLNQNYSGLFGISIDYDDGAYTIPQAKAAYADFVHIIHTSSSHMKDNPRHGGIQPRFRVILPFETSKEDPFQFEQLIDVEIVYSLMRERYPASDETVFSPGRKLYPFTGESDKYEFYLNIPEKAVHNNSIFYTITKEDLEAHKNVLDAKLATKKKGKSKNIARNDIVILKDRKTKKRIEEITKSGTMVFCNFCDDLESESASAQINIDDHGNFNLFCHHCNHVYWEQNLNWNSEKKPNLFFDADAGFPALYNLKTGKMKYFRNDRDWHSYTLLENLPREIYMNLPRCNPVTDFKKEFGMFTDEHGVECFNMFKPTKYLEKYEVIQKRIKEGKQKPMSVAGLEKNIPWIWRVLLNTFHTDENHRDIKAFLNWLAFLVQYRRQSNMAWILITNPGVGKGVIADLIIKPILGNHQVLTDEGNAIGAQFSAEDISCWVKVYNEVFTKSDFTQNLRRREWLKNRIGTRDILIERKGFDKQKYMNNISYLLFSNIEQAFIIESFDRRFSIVNVLKTSKPLIEFEWFPQDNEVFEKALASETANFSKFLQNIEVDIRAANTPADTRARRRLIEFSREDVDYVITKMNAGDYQYFDLQDIFLSSRDTFGGDAAADIIIAIEASIKNYHALPARYASQVMGHFMKQTSRTNIKRKMEQRSVSVDHQIWDPNKRKNNKYWIHESQIGFKHADLGKIVEPEPEKEIDISGRDLFV